MIPCKTPIEMRSLMPARSDFRHEGDIIFSLKVKKVILLKKIEEIQTIPFWYDDMKELVDDLVERAERISV